VNVNAFKTPPAVNVHAPGVPAKITAGIGLEICEHGATKVPASAGANPLPVTVTTVPTGPDEGESVILGALAVTVNLASATCPVVTPVTSMLYVAVGTSPTVNVKGDNTPVAENVHAPAAVITAGVGLEICGQGAKKLPASEESKPLPLTVTTVPSGPDVGLSVIEGPVTVNKA
jgi:hypothetical protein